VINGALPKANQENKTMMSLPYDFAGKRRPFPTRMQIRREDESKSSSKAASSPLPQTAVAPQEATSLLAGKRVVICEDEGVTQLQLRRVLTRAGMLVVGAAINGKEGVEITLHERPDIVLMDIRMPVMDGIESARKILESYPVCIVILTAFSDDSYQEEARSLGICGYLVKPITSDTLIPSLQKAFTQFQNKNETK